jgi:hypothetical protein
MLWMDGTQTGWTSVNGGSLTHNRGGTISKGGSGSAGRLYVEM